jgi:O-antigen/teichoic acid export membrane protein
VTAVAGSTATPSEAPATPRSLFSMTARITPLTLLSALANGLTAVVTARYFGPVGRGELVMIVTIVNITALVLSLGINTAARFHLVSREHPVDLAHYFGLALVLVAVQSVVVVCLTLLSLQAIGTPLEIAPLLLIGLFGSLFQGAYLVRDVLNAYGSIVFSAGYYAAASWMSATGIGALALLHQLTVGRVVGLLAAGALAELGLCMRFLRRRGRSLAVHWSLESTRTLIGRGVPALGINAGQSLTFRLDRYLIGLLMGAGPVGIYSVSATLSELFRTVPAAFGQAIFYRAATGTASAVSMARARARLLLAMVLPLVVLALVAPEVVGLLFGPKFHQSVQPLRILLLGELAVMSFHIDSRLLSGWGKTAKAGICGIVGVTIVGALDFALIPHFGLTGAAFASVLAYLALGTSARLFVTRETGRS